MKSGLMTKEEKKQEVAPAPKQSPFLALQREMNKLFDEFDFGKGLLSWPEQMPDFHAKVDVKDTDKEIVVTAEIPGIDIKNVEVTLRADSLTLKGEKKEEKEEKENGYYRMERSYGSFYRAIPLPCAVDRDNVAATYKDGVMKVVLPKTEKAPATEQKINVKTT